MAADETVVVGLHDDDAGVQARDVDPQVALLEGILGQMGDAEFAGDPEAEQGRVPAERAAYTDEGPFPFICAECKHIAWDDDERKVWCHRVDGPHDGEIDPEGSCRLWAARESWTGEGQPEPEQEMEEDAEHSEPDAVGDGERES